MFVLWMALIIRKRTRQVRLKLSSVQGFVQRPEGACAF